jgi:anionic cell wall polymer biosynthesis LytR-Cps2A-Psr (LCP) family protein
MDGPSFGHNTDVLSVADPGERTLLWVPRDLWCGRDRRRINAAYAHGGHDTLVAALEEHGIEVRHSICLRPDGIRSALGDTPIKVPVREPMEFRYAGQWMRFEPPVEELSGERLHAWIGARLRRDQAPPGWLPDLDRIRRQQELIAVMLGGEFDFGRFLAPGLPAQISSQAAVEELAQVRWDWMFEMLEDVVPVEIDGQDVLIRASEPSR